MIDGFRDRETYERYKNDIDYQIAIPPMGMDFRNMKKKDAFKYYCWFMENMPARMEYLKWYYANDMKTDGSELNYSAESLIPLWEWFMKIGKLENTPKDILDRMKENAWFFGESSVIEKVYSVASIFILRDIGMYFGQCFVDNHPNIFWVSQFDTDKSEINHFQPVLSSFDCVGPDGAHGRMVLNPISSVKGSAYNIYNKEIGLHSDDLFQLYQKWNKRVPPIKSIIP